MPPSAVAPPTPLAAALATPSSGLAAYAAFGLPLAMTALPLNLLLPAFYAAETGLALTAIGLVLLATRLVDAVADPLLGSWIDAQKARGSYRRPLLLAAPLLIAGVVLLFNPPALAGSGAIAWLFGTLVAAYLGYSLATVAYQAWGAELAHDDAGRARVAAAREGAGLIGVLLGGALPTVIGMPALALLFVLAFVPALWLLLTRAPRPVLRGAAAAARAPTVAGPSASALASPKPAAPNTVSLDAAASGPAQLQSAAPGPAALAPAAAGAATLGPGAPGPAPLEPAALDPAAVNPFARFLQPLATARLRWLLAVFALNALAPSITATVFQFFVADRLGLASYTGLFLALYFIAGAASMPLWLRLARRMDLAAVWLVGMAAAVAAFIWAVLLGPGQFAGFGLICVLSGLAFGADLALPPALLARVLDANGHGGSREGSYFGLWNFVNKLVLALAGGIALPLLEWLGYLPGGSDADALAALTLVYAVLPCVLKLGAAALLFAAWRGHKF